jgi:hypothetical protein
VGGESTQPLPHTKLDAYTAEIGAESARPTAATTTAAARPTLPVISIMILQE